MNNPKNPSKSKEDDDAEQKKDRMKGEEKGINRKEHSQRKEEKTTGNTLKIREGLFKITSWRSFALV